MSSRKTQTLRPTAGHNDEPLKGEVWHKPEGIDDDVLFDVVKRFAACPELRPISFRSGLGHLLEAFAYVAEIDVDRKHALVVRRCIARLLASF